MMSMKLLMKLILIIRIMKLLVKIWENKEVWRYNISMDCKNYHINQFWSRF